MGRSYNGEYSSLIRNKPRFNSLSAYVYTYSNASPQPRVKRVITTITRTFDENENLIEEREETDTEYEYVPQTNPGWWTYPVTSQPYTTWNTGGIVK